MEDEKIIELYWKRSEEAIRETAAKYGNYCFSIARTILSDDEDARECVNDAYMGAWNAIPPHRPAILASFLGKITRRIAINRWQECHAAKRGGGEVALALEELSECIPSDQQVEAQVESAELARAVNAFVMALPLSERRVFLCRYWYLEPVRDIGKRYGFSDSKVKSMLHRIRHRLRMHLKKEGFL